MAPRRVSDGPGYRSCLSNAARHDLEGLISSPRDPKRSDGASAERSLSPTAGSVEAITSVRALGHRRLNCSQSRTRSHPGTGESHSSAMRFHGAEAPKWSIPMVSPSGPTIRSYPKVAAASIETGDPPRTSVRYSSSWAKKSSQQGRLTTRAATPPSARDRPPRGRRGPRCRWRPERRRHRPEDVASRATRPAVGQDGDVLAGLDDGHRPSPRFSATPARRSRWRQPAG